MAKDEAPDDGANGPPIDENFSRGYKGQRFEQGRRMPQSLIRQRDLPACSKLAARHADAFRCEAYEALLHRTNLPIEQIYLEILSPVPQWVRALIIARNAALGPFGLHADPATLVWDPPIQEHYRPGDKILRFTIFDIGEDEIISGRDDTHLDFRVSVMRLRESDACKVVVSTMLFPHNRFGRAYATCVWPPHTIGMRQLFSKAIAQGRL